MDWTWKLKPVLAFLLSKPQDMSESWEEKDVMKQLGSVQDDPNACIVGMEGYQSQLRMKRVGKKEQGNQVTGRQKYAAAHHTG